MQDIVGRFLRFDNLLGVGLVKLIYYFGLGVICVGIIGGLFFFMMSLASGNIEGAVMQLVAIPAVGAVAIVYWRFLCEVFFVLFQMNERLGDLNDAVRGIPPDAPQF